MDATFDTLVDCLNGVSEAELRHDLFLCLHETCSAVIDIPYVRVVSLDAQMIGKLLARFNLLRGSLHFFLLITCCCVSGKIFVTELRGVYVVGLRSLTDFARTLVLGKVELCNYVPTMSSGLSALLRSTGLLGSLTRTVTLVSHLCWRVRLVANDL